ncbi:hypothetical protein CLV93_101537 [Prolixibacter denitrificans]|uniref:Uncharacterized protein n=1 Tax=Prolixibacter denitrificans TaxID=1541063 RepID=A0A2P8CKW1_9BACT|nr:hypothetical protein CLV93_101537 [Prolixibacter denitrificans]
MHDMELTGFFCVFWGLRPGLSSGSVWLVQVSSIWVWMVEALQASLIFVVHLPGAQESQAFSLFLFILFCYSCRAGMGSGAGFGSSGSTGHA